MGLTLATLLGLHAAGPALASAQSVVSRELRGEAARIFHDLARLRGLAAAGPPPRVVVRSRDERRRFIASELARKYSPARLDAERHAMVAWGLVPPDFDLSGFLTDLVLEQAAAYYDPVGKVMVLASWLGPDEQREALTHELVHALQDRQIGLDRFLTGSAGRSDEALARQSLIEGEAVALTHDLALRRQGQDLGRLLDVAALQRAIITSATGPTLGRAPRFLRTMLTFPYAQGLGFVHQFRRRHAWADLSALYRDPPRSTSQILHPERYLDQRQDPIPVRLGDLGPALGPGTVQAFEDEMGEFGLGQVLGQFLDDGTGTQSWRGDRYALWQVAGGPLLLAALTVWEDAGSAAVFAAAYTRLLPRKHGLSAPTATGSLSTWSRGDELFAVEQRGREVLLVERAPLGAIEGLRRAVWENRQPAGGYRAPARLRSTIPASITPAPREISLTR